MKLQRFLHSNHQQQSMTYHAEHPQAPQCTQEPTPQGASTGWVGRRKQLKLRGSQSGVRHQFKQRKHLRFGTISLWRLLGQPCLPHPLLPLQIFTRLRKPAMGAAKRALCPQLTHCHEGLNISFSINKPLFKNYSMRCLPTH